MRVYKNNIIDWLFGVNANFIPLGYFLLSIAFLVLLILYLAN